MSDPGDPEGRHRQVFRDENARDQTHRFLPRLATAGLTPEILELTDTRLVTREGVPFHNWWRVADNSSRADMRPLVLELVRSMHALGICHRDLHDRNLVLRREDETPLVIDLELACDVDPSGACYDLDGPPSPYLCRELMCASGEPSRPASGGEYGPWGLLHGAWRDLRPIPGLTSRRNDHDG